VHLLTLSARLEIGPTDILDPGVYIAPDIVSAQLLLMANGGSMTPLVTESRAASVQRVREERSGTGTALAF
jgi:hypothetical protein